MTITKFQRIFIQLCLLLLASNNGHAQSPKYLLTTGAGLSYVTTYKLMGNYRAIVTPHINASILVPLGSIISLESGVGYEMRGFRSDSMRAEERFTRSFYSKAVRHYMAIPLQISFNVYNKGNSSLHVSGGMNYGILLDAYGLYKNKTWFKNELPKIDKYVVRQPVKSVPKGDGFEYSRFDIGLRTQVTYIWKNKYVARVFYNYSLYDVENRVYSPDPLSYVRQHNTGVSLGIMLGK